MAKLFTLSVISSLIFSTYTFAQKVKPKINSNEILKAADEARSPSGNLGFEVTVKDFLSNVLQKENTYSVHIKGNDYSLVETLKPERLKGRKLLMRESDLWLYLPSVKKPTRVSLQQRLTGEVSNGDLARTSFYTDYTAKLLREEKYNNKLNYVLLLTAKHKATTYRKILLWVEKSELLPLKAHFFALSGKLLKTCEYSNFQMVLAKKRATETLIKDALKPQKQSLIIYSQYKLENLDDSFFSKEALQ
jgi:negative regulator of sigma E activity